MTNSRTLRLLTLILFLAAANRGMLAQTVSTKAPSARAATVADADKLDINTATPAQLKALTGIGDAYSKRIIDGRPYTAKNQLTTRGILPATAYEGIKEQIIARAPKK